ncbi:MAG TPA: hypothetical protein PLO93_00735 [Candidatus Omnitrophota bacterium]|nr:hypothetical protein [Candidatus Omnitrophota bacterium]HQL40805.1 hypothetical protein [Candidatus Omnitrophota bacterium]
MKITDLRELLKDKRVMEEIHKHLWIESQKAGYSIGLERATDEWLKLYAEGWMKYHLPEKFVKMKEKEKAEVKKDIPKTKVESKRKRTAKA